MINFFEEKSLIRDHFELATEFERGYFSFPCCVCKHRHGSDRDDPCNRCQHNEMAGKDEA